MRMSKFVATSFFGILALFLQCTTTVVSDGSATDVGNARVMGMVVGADGSGVGGAFVHLYPKGYNPLKDATFPDSLIAVTNKNGVYVIPHVDSGAYNVYVVDSTKKSKALVIIDVKKDSITAKNAILAVPGTIEIMVTNDIDTVNGYVYIPGTDIMALFGQKSGLVKSVVLHGVPIGVISSVNYGVITNSYTQSIAGSVSVTSNDTTVIALPFWNFKKNIILNTTANGANVSGMVTHFPVLVRLTNANFNFSQAQKDGNDIRFTKADNTPLSYEIERFDATLEQAEIWVNVDTVFGNDSNQFFTMYWGTSTALAVSSLSNSTFVFDTANGYQGVWHLAESIGLVYDATVNKFNGSRNGLQVQTAGMVGYAQSYPNSGEYSDVGNVLNMGTSDITVSAWINRGQVTATNTIIGKMAGNGGNTVTSKGWLFTLTYGYLRFYMSTGGASWNDSGSFCAKSSIALTQGQVWHHVAAVITRSGNSTCKLYIDGENVTDSLFGNVATVGKLSDTLHTKIGLQSDGTYPFHGTIDETSVAFRARSSDWIKLCYMNQRTENLLIKMK